MTFYQQSKKELIKQYHIDRELGLSPQNVLEQREAFGENKLPEETEKPYWRIFLKSFKEPIVIVLIIAILLSFASAYYDLQMNGDTEHGMEAIYEGSVIFILIIINACLSFWQEISAKKSLNALKEMNNRYITVLRSGHWQKIKSQELVVGDLIKVEAGDFVEGDVRWIETNELQIIESHLTGESDAICKQTEALIEEVDLADQTNMGFSGSTVSSGNGIGIVVAVGAQSELGKIATLLQSVETMSSPLQKTVNKLTKTLMIISGLIVIFTLTVGIFQSYQQTGVLTFSAVGTVLSTSIALAVASIPDALPAVLSIVLTIGASKMARNNGLIKSLNSVETLGATSYICSDKTGTLTKNEMAVTHFFSNGNSYEVFGNGYEPFGDIRPLDSSEPSDFSALLEGAVLCNDAYVQKIENKYKPFGNPTEVALVVLAKKHGITKQELFDNGFEIFRVFPFTSERKMMSVIVKKEEHYFLYTKGAPDILLQKSAGVFIHDKVDEHEQSKNQFSQKIEEYAQKALRTLAISKRKISKKAAEEGTSEELEQNFVLTGLVGIIDPPREEVKASIQTLQEAKINVVMITGDHVKTAAAIALDLGILSSENEKVIKGSDIESMSDEELFQIVKQTKVYARVSAKHKQRIVKQLQKHNEIVAMTGDGVNDVPALRAANIGIGMGITGTEVTKDSADLILLDDKFTTIEKSVESGRTIYANIKNFVRHELTTNVAEVLSLLIGLLFYTKTIGNVPASTPTLTALMVLWVNMVSDAIPSFSLGYDKAEINIMKEKPRNPEQSVLADYTWSRVLIRGIIMGALVYMAFLWAANQGMSEKEAQTVAFLTLVYGQLWHVFDARSTRTLFRRNPFENKHLVFAVLFAGISSFLVTVIPFFQTIIGTTTLTPSTYLLVVFVPAIPTFILSGMKELFRIKIW